MESKQDLASLLRESSSATEDTELAKIKLIYDVKNVDILDFVGNSDSNVIIKNVLTNENLPLRYVLVPAVGNLLIRSWVLLHEEDLEAYVSGMDSRQDVLRRKEDFLECVVDFFKQLAHYATGSPPNADIKVESMDHTIIGFNAYSPPIIELLSSFADCEKLLDEWADALCGLTNHIATSIRTKSSSYCFYRSVDLAPLVQKVLDVLIADPFLLMQSAMIKAADSQFSITLMNNICHCILKRLPPESPSFVALQPIESKVDLFSRLPDNKATNSLLGGDHTDDSSKQTEPLSVVQFISDWIFAGMLPNLGEYDNMLVDIITIISHQSLHTIRKAVVEEVSMKLVSTEDRDVVSCALQLFVFPSASLTTLCPADRPPSFWLLTRLGQFILGNSFKVNEKMVIVRLLSEWTNVALDAHFDDLLDRQFPSYHAWAALPGREALIIDVNDGYSSSSDVYGSRCQASAFKLTLQELLKPHSYYAQQQQLPSLTQTNSVIGELAAVTIMRSFYCLLENIIWILNRGIEKVDFTTLQTTKYNDTPLNNDFLDESDDITDQFAAWEERMEQLLISSLHRIANGTSDSAHGDLTDGMERSGVYLLQGLRRKMLYPAVLLTSNLTLMENTLTSILKEQLSAEEESSLTKLVEDLLRDENKRESLVHKLQVRAITRLSSTLVMIMDEALFALRMFMPVQIKWIQRQNGVIAALQLISILSSVHSNQSPLTTYLFQHCADRVECEQQTAFLSTLLVWQVEIVMKLSAFDLVRLRTVPDLLQLTLAHNTIDSSKKIQLTTFILSYCKALLTRGVEEREIIENRTARVSAGMLGGGNDEQPTYSDGSNGFGSGLYPAQEIAVEILKLLLTHLGTHNSSNEVEEQVKMFLASMLEIETELLKAEVMLLIPVLLPGHPRMIKGQGQAFLWAGLTVIKEQLFNLVRQVRVVAENKIQVSRKSMRSEAEIDELIVLVLGTKTVSRTVMSTFRFHLMTIMLTLSTPLSSSLQEANGNHVTSPSSASVMTLDLLDTLEQTPPAIMSLDSNGNSSSTQRTVVLLGLGALCDPSPRALASSTVKSGASHYADTIAVIDDVVNSCFTPLFSSFLTAPSTNTTKEELVQIAALLALDTEGPLWQDLIGSSDILILQGAFLFIDHFTKETTIKLRAYNNVTFRLPPFTLRLSISQEKDAMFIEERHVEFNEFLPVNGFIEREISILVRKFAALEVKVFVEWSDMRRNDSQSIISLDPSQQASSSSTAAALNNEHGHSSSDATKDRVWTAIIQCQSLHLPVSRLLLPYGNGSLCSMRYYSDCSSVLLNRHERIATRHREGVPWMVFAAQFQRLGSKFELETAVNLNLVSSSSELLEAIGEAVQYSQSNSMWLGLDCISCFPASQNAIIIGWSLQTLWGNEISIFMDGQGGGEGVMTIRCSDKSTLQVMSKNGEIVASLVQALTGGTVVVR